MKIKLLTFVFGRVGVVSLMEKKLSEFKKMVSIDEMSDEVIEMMKNKELSVDSFDEMDVVVGLEGHSLEEMMKKYKEYVVNEYGQDDWDESEDVMKKVVDMKDGDTMYF